MTPYYSDAWLTVYQGDAATVLSSLEPESVHCVVTSPPYWGLRDYGTASWEGGDPECPHRVSATGSTQNKGNNNREGSPFTGVCGECGARRIDAQLGLEATPEEYVAALVEVFREVRRVLRTDGTVWLNLGDSYVSNASDQVPQTKDHKGSGFAGPNRAGMTGLKSKDLVGIPWRVAFALQADGWYLRSDIIWAKPNPMPESVTDRPTKAHEMVFLLTKSPRYFFDADAVREGIGEAGVIQGPNGQSKPLVFGQDFGLERESAYSNAVGVRLAAAIFERTGRQHELGLSALDAEIGQQSCQNGASAGTVGDPIMRRAAAEAARFADGDVAAKEFLCEVDRLCIALPDGHDLKELRAGSRPTPLVDSDGDAPIAVDDAREIGQLQLIHDQEYTAQGTPRSGYMNVGARRKLPPGTIGGQSGNSYAVARDPSVGRNLRSVWTIATEPYPGAHFATFPRKLVEPCVKAGTSERGVCSECGAPWEREVERGNSEHHHRAGCGHIETDSTDFYNGGTYGGFTNTARTTGGWRPSCAHRLCSDCGNITSNGTRTVGRDLRGVRDGVPEDDAPPADSLLLQDVLEPLDIADQINHQRVRGLGEGLHPPLPARSSDGNEDGLFGRASAGDGRGPWADAPADRSGRSHQRDQERQPQGEPAGAVEEGARRHVEPGAEADGSLPAVRGALLASGSCGLCGGDLRALDPVPATILDCFAGTGTTGLVAQSLSRRAVLIDLNADYLVQCLERNRQTPLGLVTA